MNLEPVSSAARRLFDNLPPDEIDPDEPAMWTSMSGDLAVATRGGRTVYRLHGHPPRTWRIRSFGPGMQVFDVFESGQIVATGTRRELVSDWN